MAKESIAGQLITTGQACATDNILVWLTQVSKLAAWPETWNAAVKMEALLFFRTRVRTRCYENNHVLNVFQ